MGFFSAIGSAISSAVSSVGSLFTGVKDIAGPALKGVADTIFGVGKSLLAGLFPSVNNAMDMGDRVIQADEQGINLKSCDNDYERYAKEINDFKLDPDKSKDIPDDEKLRAGTTVMGGFLENFLGFSLSPMLNLIKMNDKFFNSDRVLSFLSGGLSVDKVHDYFTSNLNRHESKDMESQLVKNEVSNGSDELGALKTIREQKN